MKRILLATLLALLPFVGPASSQPAGPVPVFCNRIAVFSTGATSITQIVAAQTGLAIHICGYDINAGAAAATFQLTAGTGTNCNTNATNITPVFSLGINGVLVSRAGSAWYSSPAGYMLCMTITGTGPLNVVVSYGQY